MRNRIKIQGERVSSTRSSSTTTIEATIYQVKKQRLYSYINKKLSDMGIDPLTVKQNVSSN